MSQTKATAPDTDSLCYQWGFLSTSELGRSVGERSSSLIYHLWRYFHNERPISLRVAAELLESNPAKAKRTTDELREDLGDADRQFRREG